jgi:hypothetical protein
MLDDLEKNVVEFQRHFLHPYGILCNKNAFFKAEDKIDVLKKI